MSLADGKLEELEETFSRARVLLSDLDEEIASKEQQLIDIVTHKVALENVDMDALRAFGKKPYTILPKSTNEAWIICPRFVDFHVGWLERQDSSFNIFVVNQYVDMISPLPHDIRARIGVDPYLSKAVIRDRGELTAILEINPEEYERVKQKYGKKLIKRVPNRDDQIYIQKGQEFELLAQLISDGMLPFEAKPVEEEDLRPPSDLITLRPYQERAWNKFLEYGAIGIYWAPGAGKTFEALEIGNRVKGNKLVVVPQLTLLEQWKERIQKFTVDPKEWEVQTYQAITHKKNYARYQRKKFKVITYDECHHLPANTFSKLAVLETDYRVGLSASPYREDGRTEYIFALTGFPVGLKWRELISIGVVSEPDVKVFLYSTKYQKRNDVETLMKTRSGKIIIFCDSINLGNSMAKQYGIPFVYRKTKNRLQVVRDNRVTIVSRVGDEGMSIPELETVIEFDFHAGSRRQEAQRAGRLMHGEGGEHIIQMTDEELMKYEKRLFSLEEQGFRIRFERRA